MSRKNQKRTMVEDRILYKSETPNGWAIVIMPDNILIGNYLIGKVHIHLNPSNHSYKLELKNENCDEIFDKIVNYINFCKKLDVEELMEMLS